MIAADHRIGAVGIRRRRRTGALVVALVVPLAVATAPATAARRPIAACTLGTRLAGWSLDRLAAQTLVVPVDEGSVGTVAAEVRSGAGGILLLGDDATPALKSGLAALTGAAEGGVRPAVMVDEEGGEVQRLADLVGALPSARTMAATLTTAEIEALGEREGARLRALGATVDLAPVLDLDARAGPNDRDPDGTRSFSANPTIAYTAASAFSRGLIAEGIVPVDKHFPGLGGVSANTDLAPAETVPYADLERSGLLPFERAIAAGAPAIMVSNASVPGLSSLPASISPVVIGTLLRRELGFSGLVITDAVSAPSVTPAGGSLARSVVAVIAAGADMVLWNSPAPKTAATDAALTGAIATAVADGTIARNRLETAVGRILMVKHELPACP